MDVKDEDTNSEETCKQTIISRYNTVNSRNYYNKRANGGTITFKEENIPSYTDANGAVYRVTDHVYMDTNKPNQPFAIGCTLDFKLTKKDATMIEVQWYYRPNEIPDGVYTLLMQDRYHETNSISPNDLVVLDPIIKGRELFASECRDIYPASFIKGKCKVFHYQDILEARDFNPYPDTFFCTLTYNPEARRLANTQGEIRVGASHQAKWPTCRTDVRPEDMDEKLDDWETAKWKCKIDDDSLLTYLNAARSIAAFAGMCDRGNTEDMYDAVQRDDTTINAFNILHDNNYEIDRALQCLVKCPILKGVDRKWNDEDQKKFVKGLRQYGKNFYRIKRDLLPHKETSDLVEFYYLWKKTPGAQNSRPRRRIRPPSSIKKQSSKKSSNNTNVTINSSNVKNEGQFTGSDTDSDNESDESDNKPTQLYCKHCTTTNSKDWQPGGRDNQLLCYDCRMYYKKYGELPSLNDNSSQTATVNGNKIKIENTFTPIAGKCEAKTPPPATPQQQQQPPPPPPVATTQADTDRDMNSSSVHDDTAIDLSMHAGDHVLDVKVKVENGGEVSTKQPHHPIPIQPPSSAFSATTSGAGGAGGLSLHNLKAQMSPLNHNVSNQSSFHVPHSSSNSSNSHTGVHKSQSNDLLNSFMSPFMNPLLLQSGLLAPPPPLSMLQLHSPSQQQQQQQQQRSPFLQPPQHQCTQQRQQNNDENGVDADDANDDEPVDPRLLIDDGPPPTRINMTVQKPTESIKPDSNAMFVRVWDRNGNICSRTDLQFKYLPNCKYLKYKNSVKPKEDHNKSKSNNDKMGNSGIESTYQSHSQPFTAHNHNTPQAGHKMQKPNEAQFNLNFDPVAALTAANQQFLANSAMAGNNGSPSMFAPHLLPQQPGQQSPFHPSPSQQQQLTQKQQQQQALESTPALRQLRDIADRSNPFMNQFSRMAGLEPLPPPPPPHLSAFMHDRYAMEQQLKAAAQQQQPQSGNKSSSMNGHGNHGNHSNSTPNLQGLQQAPSLPQSQQPGPPGLPHFNMESMSPMQLAQAAQFLAAHHQNQNPYGGAPGGGLPPFFAGLPPMDPFHIAAREREMAALQNLNRRQQQQQQPPQQQQPGVVGGGGGGGGGLPPHLNQGNMDALTAFMLSQMPQQHQQQQQQQQQQQRQHEELLRYAQFDPQKLEELKRLNLLEKDKQLLFGASNGTGSHDDLYRMKQSKR